jgi:hypothetical protein
MPDSQPRTPILVSYKDLAKLMVKHEGLHEGLWGVYIRFGLRATNIPVQVEEHTSVMPAAILPILEIGIQPFAEATDLTIDAAVVNPKPRRKGAKPSRKTGKKK